MYFIFVGLALSAVCVFSSFEEQGLPFIGVHWLLICGGFSYWGAQALGRMGFTSWSKKW